jgi:hypothetical protein
MEPMQSTGAVNMQNAQLPKEVAQALANAEDVVTKGVSGADVATATYSPAAALVAPQNLSPILTNLAERKTPLYNTIEKRKGFGQAVVFNLISSLFGTGESAAAGDAYFSDGGTATEKKTLYKNVSNAYKLLGFKGQVTGTAIRTMQPFADLEAVEVGATMRRVMQALEWLLFWSRADTTYANGLVGFSGMDELITTNVVDANGAPLSKALFDAAAKKIAYQGGMDENFMVFASIGNTITLNNIYNTQQNLIINVNDEKRDNLTLGNIVPKIQTNIGVMNVMADYFVNPGLPYTQGTGYSASSGPAGVPTSSVFILPMNQVYLSELLAISKFNLAQVGDAVPFQVLTQVAPVLTAEPWAAKIINTLDS